MTIAALIEVQCDGGTEDILEIACIDSSWRLSGNQPERLIGVFSTPKDVVDFMRSRNGTSLFKKQVWHYYGPPFLHNDCIGGPVLTDKDK